MEGNIAQPSDFLVSSSAENSEVLVSHMHIDFERLHDYTHATRQLADSSLIMQLKH